MIRDGFKQENTKKVSVKEMRKKQSMGERSYYATQIPKLRDMTRSISVSTVITLVMIGLAYAFVLLAFILSLGTEEEYGAVRFAIWSSVFGVVAIWSLLWFTVFKPANLRKAERYKKELERLNAETVSKVGGAYKVYGDKYIEELRRRNSELKPRAASAEGSSEQTTAIDGSVADEGGEEPAENAGEESVFKD